MAHRLQESENAMRHLEGRYSHLEREVARAAAENSLLTQKLFQGERKNLAEFLWVPSKQTPPLPFFFFFFFFLVQEELVSVKEEAVSSGFQARVFLSVVWMDGYLSPHIPSLD